MTVLDGRVTIITGAGRGLGKSIAEQMAHAGSSVAVGDLDIQAAEEAATELAGQGVAAKPYRVDVSDPRSVEACFAAVVADFGRLDVVVNNAGVSFVGPHITDTDDEAWNRTIGVMQSGVFYCMRAAAKYFLPQRSGAIVNISSIRGFSASPGRVAYCAAKAAVLMMTQVAAGEWAPYGVRCNAIAPGVQKTPMWDQDVAAGVCDEEKVLAVTPAGRLGRPEEVGKLAVFLASDDAAFINGSCVTIDGGLTSVPIDGAITRPE
ncbi:MAG: glucose 1-dehydrogenase [Micromonosporaceae bacterium]|nr:glucose 1-dehydrogenase [Micromonosporaceae bacterium]